MVWVVIISVGRIGVVWTARAFMTINAQTINNYPQMNTDKRRC